MAVIKVRCKSCKAMLKFPSAKAGKRVRCPECDEIVRVPEEEVEAPAKKEKEAIQAKNPAPPPPTPAAPPPTPAHAGDEDEDGPKTYGLIAPAATPSLEDNEPKKKKKEEKIDFKSRIKKRVIHEADEWQKINSALMLAFIAACIMMVVWLLNLITFATAAFFNDAKYSLVAEKLLIRRTVTPVTTGAYTLTINKKLQQGPQGGPLVIAGDDPIDAITAFPSKPHELKATAGSKYTIILQSTDFDAFLRIEDGNKRNLMSDDNSGGGKDAKLEFDAPSDGKFYIIATSSLNVPYEINRNAFVTALTFGGRIELGRVILIISSLAALGQGAIFLLAYFICMAVPNINSTRSLALSMVSLGIVNLVLLFMFKLLPATGAIGYIMLPFVLPELAMVPMNIERLQPLHMFWSPAPFWETFAALLFAALIHGEVILFCIFLRAVATALKEDYLQEKSLGLIKLSFGVLFIYFTYQVISITGTSNVLLGLLRIMYILYLGFYIGFVINLAIVLMTARKKIEDLLEPEEGAEGEDDDDEGDEDDEDDEEDEEDEDEDDDDEDDEDEDDEDDEDDD